MLNLVAFRVFQPPDGRQGIGSGGLFGLDVHAHRGWRALTIDDGPSPDHSPGTSHAGLDRILILLHRLTMAGTRAAR
jgi:hypothetical protein